MLEKLKRWLGITEKKNRHYNLQSWGLERAVLDLLGQADKDWVSLRYKLALDYIKKEDCVLDAACGSGFGSEILSEKSREVYAVDISTEAVNYAKERHSRSNINFLTGDVTKLDFKNDFFDVAVGIETLEHLEEYEKYLKQIKRVTKNNGKVIISTPQKKSDIPLTPFHIKEFSYNEFKQLIQKYFFVEKIVGLKRLEKPEFEIMTDDNFYEYDIYLGICKNLK